MGYLHARIALDAPIFATVELPRPNCLPRICVQARYAAYNTDLKIMTARSLEGSKLAYVKLMRAVFLVPMDTLLLENHN